MVGVGLILVLVGFGMIASGGSLPGSASSRNVRIGSQRFSTPGSQTVRSTRYRVIQIAMGLVVLAGGVVMIWFS